MIGGVLYVQERASGKHMEASPTKIMSLIADIRENVPNHGLILVCHLAQGSCLNLVMVLG
jgi:hypothetical protein